MRPVYVIRECPAAGQFIGIVNERTGMARMTSMFFIIKQAALRGSMQEAR